MNYVTALFLLMSATSFADTSASDQEAQCRGVAIVAAAKQDLELDLRQLDFSSRNPNEENLDWGIKLKSAEAKDGYDVDRFSNIFEVHFVSGTAPVHPEANVLYEVVTRWTATGCVAGNIRVTAEE